LKKIFLFQDIPNTVDTCIIVIEVELEKTKKNVGLIVDKVLEVIQIEENLLNKNTFDQSKGYSKYIKGLIKRNEEFSMILDVNKLLSLDEFKILVDYSSK